MGVISTGSFPKLLWPGLNAIYGMSYKEHIPQWSQCFSIENSSKAYEEDLNTVGMGLAPIKPSGSATVYDTMQQSYLTRYTAITYSLGYIITLEMKQDNQYAQFANKRTRGLSFSMNQTKEIVHANIFERAFNANYVFGDGKPMCSLLHPTPTGAQANKLTEDADLSELALEEAVIAIKLTRDDRGNKIGVYPKKLLVATQNIFNAERILKNPARPATADRDINALYQTGAIPGGFTANPYLDDPDAWFIITDCQYGLTHFKRIAPVFKDDNEFDTDNTKFKTYERYSAGISNFRGIYGSQGA